MTTLMIATPGGHIAELLALAPRLQGADGDHVWVTWRDPQTESLLAGRRVVWAQRVEPRDALGAARELPRAFGLLRSLRPRAAVSTGSAIAVPYLAMAAAFGIPAHYIEAATRTSGPSLSGRILSALPGVATYTQFENGASKRWLFRGSVFDGYAPAQAAPRAIRRVVVTLGTMTDSFRRALERLASQLPDGCEVLWQTGHTPVAGLPIHARPFVPAAELEQAIRDADVVVGHCGVGTALTAFQAGRLPVLLPRDPNRGEVVDFHQVELATHLVGRGLARVCDASALTMNDLEATTGVQVLAQDPGPFQLETTPRR